MMKTSDRCQTDLVVLAADSKMRAVLDTLLSRRRDALGLGQFSFDILVHPQRDAGAATSCVQILRAMLRTHRLALVVFDHHGSGRLGSPDSVCKDVERQLELNGWRNRACAVCISPELEAWVPFSSSATADALGLSLADLAHAIEPYCPAGASKPTQPKEAFEAALRAANRRVSPAIYQAIAKRASLTRCADPGFARLCAFLREYFAAPSRGT